jgi:hypothetical protein
MTEIVSDKLKIGVIATILRRKPARLECMLTRAALLLSILSFVAAAQTPVSNWQIVKMLPSGTQVRVADGTAKPTQGTLESVTDSELVVLAPGTGPQSFPRARVASVSLKEKDHRLRNALIGLGVGTAAGLGIGYGVGRSGCSSTGGWCGLDTSFGTVVGGVGGLVGGTLFGVFWPTGGWHKIYAT